ncbi:MAG: hypothetical protein ILO53_05630, partial [Clostridia bacterium]|nr:hypothetical protein [Clostridia bacterium]
MQTVFDSGNRRLPPGSGRANTDSQTYIISAFILIQMPAKFNEFRIFSRFSGFFGLFRVFSGFLHGFRLFCDFLRFFRFSRFPALYTRFRLFPTFSGLLPDLQNYCRDFKTVAATSKILPPIPDFSARLYVRPCVRLCVRPCLRLCVRPCVRLCLRSCVRL